MYDFNFFRCECFIYCYSLEINLEFHWNWKMELSICLTANWSYYSYFRYNRISIYVHLSKKFYLILKSGVKYKKLHTYILKNTVGSLNQPNLHSLQILFRSHIAERAILLKSCNPLKFNHYRKLYIRIYKYIFLLFFIILNFICMFHLLCSFLFAIIISFRQNCF